MFEDFDDFIMVKWSAKGGTDGRIASIWSAGLHDSAKGHATRHECYERVKRKLLDCIDNDKRILCGFDFCFGFPKGAVGELRKKVNKQKSNKKNWEWLWEYLYQKIDDEIDNEHNCFAVASEINRLLTGKKGPFWGYPTESNISSPAYLSSYKDKDITGKIFEEKRYAEKIKGGGLSVWQLYYAGAVGSQSLLGISRLQGLRVHEKLKEHIAVYPFQDCSKAKIVFAEAYFGKKNLQFDENIKPEYKAKVIAAVNYCEKKQQEGTLKDLFVEHKEPAILEEGWVFNKKEENV